MTSDLITRLEQAEAGSREFVKTMTLACNAERRLIAKSYNGDVEKKAKAARRATVTLPLIAVEALLRAIKEGADG